MKKIISLILTLNLLLLCIPCGYAAFTDVENSIAIDTVVGLGLMEVNADGAFMPDENLTRGEFAQIIAKIYTYGEEDNSVAEWKENFFEGVFEENKFISPEDMEKTKAGIEGMFEDVLTSNDYYDAITLVATKGIMVGKGGKYFDPEFGLMDELYCKAKIQSYLELFTD